MTRVCRKCGHGETETKFSNKSGNQCNRCIADAIRARGTVSQSFTADEVDWFWGLIETALRTPQIHSTMRTRAADNAIRKFCAMRARSLENRRGAASVTPIRSEG